MSPNCLNCGTPLHTGQHFCAQCGQKADTHRISLHEISHDAIHYFTHADKGIFQLLRMLATRPGVVAREYIDGKRKAYFKPLNIFLIVAGILVFMSTTFHKDNPRPPARRSAAQASPTPITPEQRAYYMAMGKRGQKVNNISDKYGNFIMMLATPLLSWFLWFCFMRARFNYLEHLVANMYFTSFIMLFFALVLVPLRSVFEQQYMYFLMLFFLVEVIYRGIAYYQLMGKKGKWPLFKAIGISLLASAVWFAISFGTIWYYIRYGF